MSLFLIGYRGTGKTTVAEQLGTRLGWTWVDADAEIERRAGKPIAEIFAADGEECFRDLEMRVIADLAQQDRAVVAAGGGAVGRAENRAAMRRGGRVVWLTAAVETILRRIQHDPSTALRRPNLTAAGGEAEVRTLLAQREPLYRETADFEVATEGKTPAEIAREICELLGQHAVVAERANQE